MLYLGLLAYTVFVLVVLLFQRRLIYFPARLTATDAEQLATDHGFVPWHAPDHHVIGWKMPAAGTVTGSVLIVHGNAGCALNRDYLARPIHDAAPVDVYVLEYPGYGARPGSPNKTSMVEAAEEAFHELPANLPRYVVSESIGAGVAAELARSHPRDIAGLALVAPYHNLASVAQRRMFWLPAYVLLLDRFNPQECLKSYHGPIVFVVAGADEIIGPASGQRLADSYAGPKQLTVITGATHNEVAAQLPNWWRDVFSFWQQSQAH